MSALSEMVKMRKAGYVEPMCMSHIIASTPGEGVAINERPYRKYEFVIPEDADFRESIGPSNVDPYVVHIYRYSKVDVFFTKESICRDGRVIESQKMSVSRGIACIYAVHADRMSSDDWKFYKLDCDATETPSPKAERQGPAEIIDIDTGCHIYGVHVDLVERECVIP